MRVVSLLPSATEVTYRLARDTGRVRGVGRRFLDAAVNGEQPAIEITRLERHAVFAAYG